MVHTGVVIDKESWAVLRDEPLYSARFIDRDGTDELALVLRVELLDLLLEADPPLALDVTTWQSSQGTWVVIVAYHLHPLAGGARGGTFYFNPRGAAGAGVLRKLFVQEKLYVIFLSEDCGGHYTAAVPLDPRALGRGRECLAAAGAAGAGDDDPAFARAVQEFEALSHP